MPWANLDDQFPEHPHNDRLSDAAFRLHVAGICYANKHMTDGKIPPTIVPRLVPKFRKTALDELLGGDRPHWTQNGEGYEIRDFLQWNRSRAQVIAERERKSKGGRKGAQNRWHKPEDER